MPQIGKVEFAWNGEIPEVSEKPGLNGLYPDEIFAKQLGVNLQGKMPCDDGPHRKKYFEGICETTKQIAVVFGIEKAMALQRNFLRNCETLTDFQ